MAKKSQFIFWSLNFLLFLSFVNAQGQADETGKNVRESPLDQIYFRVPDKFTKLPLNGFDGYLLLSHRAPAGIFIAFPNENESIEDLSERLSEKIPLRLMQYQRRTYEWKTKSISGYKDDIPNTAQLKLAEDGRYYFQVALFQRKFKDSIFIYGYFAMKDEGARVRNSRAFGYEMEFPYWLNESGKGVADFDKFRKSLP